MLNNTVFDRVLNFFIEAPNTETYLRELARIVKISPYSAKHYLDMLVKQGILTEMKKGKMRIFKSDLSNPIFRHLKITYSIKTILESGLIDFLKNKIPIISSIVVYGSAARGEDSKNSDIDLLIIGKKVDLDLEKFKKKLKKNITVLIFTTSEWKGEAKKNKAFYQNIIIDGVVLHGNMPVIE